MRRSQPPRALALTALVAAAVGLGLVQGVPSAGATTSTTITSKPAVSTALLPGSLRGQYEWNRQPASPSGTTARDVYYRDSTPWTLLEPSPGNFDDGYIDEGLATAAARGGRFGFRVMAWCPGCYSNPDNPDKAWTLHDWVPSWLPVQAGSTAPDWNDDAFLSAWEGLWQHLGSKYADDPRLGWIDVGGYGPYGEFHGTDAGTPITVANAKRLANAVLDNFPRTHVVVNAMDPTLTNALLAMSPRLGLRADCLGAPDMYSLIATSKAGSLIAERWRTQPVMTEWCNYPLDTTVASTDVRRYHVSTVGSLNSKNPYTAMSSAQQSGFRTTLLRAGYRYGVTAVNRPTSVTRARSFTFKIALANTGSAPTYDAWTSTLQLINTRTGATTEQDLKIDLRTLLTGTKSYTRAVVAPASAGSYAMRLVVRDPSGYLAPMALANVTQPTPGAYSLGTLTVK